MYEEILLHMLRLWRDRLPPSDLIERHEAFEILDLFERPKKIVNILGPRRAGKTYFVFQIYRDIVRAGGKAVYFNFEDERIDDNREVLSDFLTVVKSEFGGGDVYLLLDEIQRVEGWSRWVRRVYDTERYRVLVTGSTSKLMGVSIPYELGGRILSILVLPLRFSEFLRFKNESIDFSIVGVAEDERARLIRLLNEYLIYGGLPEVVLAPDYKKILILQEYYRTVLARDISGGKIRNVELLDKFLKLIARAKQMSISKLYNALRGAGYKVGKGTLLEYFDRAKEAFFVYSVPVHYESLKARIQMPKKVYLTDTGYLTALIPRVDMGRLLENAVYLELFRRYWHDPKIEITYWTDGTNEVDFAVKKGAETIELIQVSYDISDLNTRSREIRALRKAMKRLGTPNAFLVTGFQKGKIEFGEAKIEVLPYWEWERKQQPKYTV